MKPKPMTDDEIGAILSSAIEDAVSFIESDIQPQRIKAQRYFDGEVDIGHEEGRSKVVATKCRDVVRAIKPSLMRVFFSHDKPVEFIPRTPNDVSAAEQATDYINWKFNEENGFRLLNDVFHDAAVKKVGILKAYYEEYSEVEFDEYNDLTDDEFALIAADPEIDLIEHSVKEGIGPEGPITLHDAKVSWEKEAGSICIKPVPPEEFFIDAEARSIEDFYICGHRTEMRVGDLVEMGFDFDEVIELAGDAGEDEESQRRRRYSEDNDQKTDPSMRTVLVADAYMKMDIEGTGIPRLYSFLAAGTSHKMLSYEVCDEVPFATFEVDPEPHTFFGRSIVDLIMPDQDAATVMLRGVLDNVAQTNMPRMLVDDTKVNMDDMMNNEIGGVVRTKDMTAVQPLSVPFVAGTTLPALQYMDDLIEAKTGVSRASVGLDPDALQGATATAVQATMGAAAGQVEVMARNLAEGGMRRLFRLLLRLTHKHVPPGEMMRLNGKFVPVDPRSWNVHMHLIANVGLGTGQHEMRAVTLRESLQMQLQIWAQYGPTNGLVTLTGMRNTFADINALAGIHNSDRYVNPMDPETEAMLMQQAAEQAARQQAGGGGDPAQLFALTEAKKAETRAQADVMKAQIRAQTEVMRMQNDMTKAAADDDLKRDEMDQQLIVRAAEILAKYGARVDMGAVKAAQDAPRDYPGV